MANNLKQTECLVGQIIDWGDDSRSENLDSIFQVFTKFTESANEKHAFSGTVLIVPNLDFKKRDDYKDIREKLYKENKNTFKSKDLLDDLWNQITSNFDRDDCYFFVDFKITNGGIVELSARGKSNTKEENFILCRQAFYFIKSDVVFSSSITDIDKIEPFTSLVNIYQGKDLLNISSSLVSDIRRFLILMLEKEKIIRTGKDFYHIPHLLNLSIEMIAIGKSLITELVKLDKLPKDDISSYNSEFDNIKEFVTGLKNDIKEENDKKLSIVSTTRAYFLFLLALLTPILLFFRQGIIDKIVENRTSESVFVTLVSDMFSSDLHILLMVLFIALFYLQIINRSTKTVENRVKGINSELADIMYKY